jgi:hypothetical protein
MPLRTSRLKKISVWKFPESIDYSRVTEYLLEFDKLPNQHVIMYDLVETEHVHPSFIGFLIISKEKLENRGGKLVLKLSAYLKNSVDVLGLDEYFFS